MNQPVLYSFRRCPYAIRARLALRCAGVPYELREVALRNKPADMLALSPKGTVPVLRLPDGQVLEQSLDIMRWALSQADPQGWLTHAPLDEMLELIDLNDRQFKPLLDRYKYPERHPDQHRDCYRQQAMDTMLLTLNQRLLRHRHLCASNPCLADMAIVPFVRQFAQVDREWWDACELLALRHWLNALTSSELFEAVMAKPDGN
ncbi:MAG: glutathione S-transferase [Aquabacterium sp.]|uniref:glutathione S-transferase n=1 Tax=Aquabacterium sp. TaxID=1872578 RepID=UPI001217DF36|nr:glutathione S-transferase [Aquabacterium sp.]TAK97482.1 MAG: glutathione S-transferase [Aquabacterium sp.]